MMRSFAEDMIAVDLEPSSFVVDEEEIYTVKGMHQILLGVMADKYEGKLDTETKVQIVSAVVCAAVTERDPAEAIKYLVSCGVDAPTDFVGSIIDTFDYLDEYQLLHPPDIIHRRDTEGGTEYEITERN
jgi:hypothetical protein